MIERSTNSRLFRIAGCSITPPAAGPRSSPCRADLRGVQFGKSGGAAIDDSGRVIGVVVSKPNALAIACITGNIPQNVNFAISRDPANSFEAHNVAYQADPVTRELSNRQRAEQTEAGSVQSECRK